MTAFLEKYAWGLVKWSQVWLVSSVELQPCFQPNSFRRLLLQIAYHPSHHFSDLKKKIVL
jgi:hypothetical protein